MADTWQARWEAFSTGVTARAASAKTRINDYRRRHPAVFWSGTLVGLPLLACVLAVATFITLVYTGSFGKIPSREVVKNVETPEASYLLDRDGNYIARYFDQNRESIDGKAIPQVLKDALVATEDERFTTHSGIDWQATARAVVYSGLLRQEEQGGGSTLSQQLAKNHFPRAGGGKFSLVVTKIKEAITAKRFEKEYTKDELLTLYLNTVPFGENIYGVKLASRRFFDVEPLALKTEQAAVLVGMLKANSSYHPVWHPEASLKRRNLVMVRMAEQGFLPIATLDSLRALPLVVRETKETSRGQSTYFSDRVRLEVEAILDGKRDAKGNDYHIDKSGLRIYSTLDPELQKLAERALQDHLAYMQPKFRDQWRNSDPDGFEAQLDKAIKASPRYKELIASGLDLKAAMNSFGESRQITFADYSAYGRKKMKSSYRDSLRAELLRLRAAFIAADPNSGEVLAYVGGGDYFAIPFNSAAAKRQVGSTFKPLVYAVALENGFQVCDYFKNKKETYGTGEDEYTPENSDGRYGGEYSMTAALVNSVNTIAVATINELKPSKVVAFADKIGLKGVPNDLSAALGTASLSIEDMIRLYGIFARDGTVPTYRMVSRIETREGEVVWAAPASMQAERVVSTNTAEAMRYMLTQVAERGTGSGLARTYGVESDVAGKTGTTQDQADGWFMGFTNEIVVGAWVGAEYPNIRWKSLSLGQGAKTALPIVGKFLRGYELSRGTTKFPEIERFPEDTTRRYECSDRRWKQYAFDSLWMDNGELYEPGVGFDEDGNPIYFEPSEAPAPPEDGAPAPPRKPGTEPPAGPTDVRTKDDPARVREREANNQRLEELRREAEENKAGDEERGLKRGLKKLFKKDPD